MMAALYLFPTLLSDVDWQECLPVKNVEKILSCEYFIVEELRTARRFLRKIGYTKSFDEVGFYLLNEHSTEQEIMDSLEPLRNGKDVFLMSEAGLPCVADPGSKAVLIAQKMNAKVVPLAGPSSIYMSLMASGFNGQNFAFLGYLPVKEEEKLKKLRRIEERVYKENQTQIFIETPYRNDKLFLSMLKIFKDDTLLCVASDITSINQSIRTQSIGEWKKEKNFYIGKVNTIFLVYR
ncbi:MAG: SAM-dependent methyltransferase [Bacteroidales bacterium]|nr:SAM-dependent methyltransferase [Bacteroidales bacterium]